MTIKHETDLMTAQERERLLAELTPRERKLVERVLADYPTLPVAQAIEMLRNAGM